MQIPSRLVLRAAQANRALDRALPPASAYPATLMRAMRYSIFSGGKRVRPFLVLETAALFGQSAALAAPLAAAVEMIHAYSLIHDDLPAMDDDDVRRGRPTCHRKFGEAAAILAGDALFALAFETISGARGVDAGRIAGVTGILSRAVGPLGMVGGQQADLEFQKKKMSLERLKVINGLKTGALIEACCVSGAIWAGAAPSRIRQARLYGNQVGFLFQLVDDILDGDGYAGLEGVERTYAKAARVRDLAKKALAGLGKKAATLEAFADYLYERKS
ncbi:MAG: polyprenyl synthetase family protein [Candidatus Omnitrophica bacterium]|nr:polyprenyl synthetase family protein [Candidatus Omnitrophota bacterium]